MKIKIERIARGTLRIILIKGLKKFTDSGYATYKEVISKHITKQIATAIIDLRIVIPIAFKLLIEERISFLLVNIFPILGKF